MSINMKLLTNILKMFYSQKSMKRKILDIMDDVKKVVLSTCSDKFWIDWYGAYDINPQHLVIWVCVESDVVKSRLESNTELISKFREILVKHGYPEQAIPFVHIGFESKETVDRESNGNWHHHFK